MAKLYTSNPTENTAEHMEKVMRNFPPMQPRPIISRRRIDPGRSFGCLAVISMLIIFGFCVYLLGDWMFGSIQSAATRQEPPQATESAPAQMSAGSISTGWRS